MKKFLKTIIVKMNLINFFSIFFYVFRIFKIKNNKIVCINFSGKGYGDSPKYIAEELLNDKMQYDIVWLVNNLNDENFPSNIRKVRIFSIKSYYELATAKIWINNSRFDQFVRKRKNQIYIQTWHGGLALKKIEYDAIDKLSEYYKKVMENDNKMIDYMISNSDFCTKMYRRAFKYKGEIIDIGTPRNDILVNYNSDVRKKVENYYNIDSKKKILLYAPTFRNSYEKNPYDIDFLKLKNELEYITKDNWEIVVKLHPRISNSDILKSKVLYIDASNYSDMQELIISCDLLITDYSSTMFESLIADKPVIIYANDIESYINERGLYFDFNELPFKLAKNNNELINIVRNNNIEELKKNYNIFKNKIVLKETGKSSSLICKLIKCEIEK